MNIVFDFGAVVFRWAPEQFLQRLAPEHAPDAAAAAVFSKAFFQSFGGDWGEFDRGALDADTLAERTAQRLDLPLAEVQRIIAAVPDELQPLPDTVALIERLKAHGHRLFYLSNMPAPYARILESRHAVDDWFEAGVFSSRVGLIKPDPAIFREAERVYGVPGASLLFIDDVAKNVDAAKAAGWQAVQFVGATQLEADLRQAKALN